MTQTMDCRWSDYMITIGFMMRADQKLVIDQRALKALFIVIVTLCISLLFGISIKAAWQSIELKQKYERNSVLNSTFPSLQLQVSDVQV